MSAYDNDPRVRRDGDRYWVTHDADSFGPSSLRVESVGDGTFARFVEDIQYSSAVYNTADEAIRSLIGDPQ